MHCIWQQQEQWVCYAIWLCTLMAACTVQNEKCTMHWAQCIVHNALQSADGAAGAVQWVCYAMWLCILLAACTGPNAQCKMHCAQCTADGSSRSSAVSLLCNMSMHYIGSRHSLQCTADGAAGFDLPTPGPTRPPLQRAPLSNSSLLLFYDLFHFKAKVDIKLNKI